MTNTDYLCVKCSLPLSIKPISLTKDGDVCGRHETIEEEHYINQLYHTLMQHDEFNCCFRKNGCLETFTFAKMPTHEKVCNYQEIGCFFTCTKTFLKKDALEHYQMEHKEKFLEHNQLGYDLKTPQNVSAWCTSETKEVYLVKCYLSNNSLMLLVRKETRHADYNKTIKVNVRTNYNFSYNIEDNVEKNLSKIDISTEEKVTIILETESESETTNSCVLCDAKFYSTKMCVKCKSFCGKCLLDVPTRFDLEEKYENCLSSCFKYKVSPPQEASFYVCPYKISAACSKSGVLEDVIQHCLQFHNCVKLDQSNSRIKRKINVTVKLMHMSFCYDGNLFFSVRYFDEEDTVRWKMFILNNEIEARKYSYHLKVCKSGKSYEFSKWCQSIYDENKDNWLKIPMKISLPFLRNMCVDCEIGIEKDAQITEEE